ADEARRAALRAADQAQGAIDRHRDAAALFDRRLAEIAEAAKDAAEQLAVQESALAALPDDSIARAALEAEEHAADRARTDANAARDALAAHERTLASLSERQAVVSAEIKSWKARAGEAARRVTEMDKRADALAAEAAKLADAPAKLAEQRAAAEAQQADLREKVAAAEAQERAAEAALREAETALNAIRERVAGARETRAGAIARSENAELRRIEMGRLSGERFECPPPLLPQKAGFESGSVGDANAESAQHDRLVSDRERLGPVNLVAADELAELDTEREKNAAEIEELTQAVHRLRGSIGNLNREGRVRLLAAFEAVNQHFQRLFTTLFNGGQAHLELVDSDDPLEAGLEIMAQPPGKRLGTLTLLSGGEQALTAVALIFGLFLTNPAPICVLDEVDAPLDDANIERFCDLLDRMARETNTRYLIVTHNAVTMARMHRLFGVTMIERGVSRLVSVDLGGAEELLAAE
ncbi:MAG: chromosome segregation protein, partial [Sphingopyxis sp.]